MQERYLALDFQTGLGKSTVRILLALLLVWGFGLRLWYATPRLDSTRFWDERYGLENLEPLLKEGRWRPVHGFHPGFSYLPHGLLLKTSDLLHRTTGWPKLAIFDARGRYTPTAYLICRTLSVAFGTLTLLLLYKIGRRLGGDRLGLLAAFLLAVVPWHLRQSILFKADITLLFTVVLTVYWSLRAIDNPSVRSFAVTGVGIGLALSSKFNAGPVAIPLTVGALLGRGSKRRALLLLIAAAAVSIAVFLLLQPYVLIDPDIYRRSMSTTSRVYEKVAKREGHGRLYLFWHLIQSLASPSFHGPLIGCLAVVGLGIVAILATRHRRTSPVALPWLMVLSYVFAYTALYALATPRPSPHNWLPISPFAALGAAWSLLAVWLWLRERFAPHPVRVVGTIGAVALVVIGTWQASSYVYRETVPHTGDRALDLLRARLRKPDGRLVFTEHDFGSLFQDRHKKGRLAIRTVGRLDEFEHRALDRVDAEVFPASVMESPDRGGFYRQRLAQVKERDVVTIEPRLFRAWGPSLVVALHPLKNPVRWPGEWVRTADHPRRYAAEIPPPPRPGLHYSIEFRAPKRTEVAGLEIEGQEVELIRFRGPRRQMPSTTTRFEHRSPILLELSRDSGPDRFPLVIRAWKTPRGPSDR